MECTLLFNRPIEYQATEFWNKCTTLPHQKPGGGGMLLQDTNCDENKHLLIKWVSDFIAILLQFWQSYSTELCGKITTSGMQVNFFQGTIMPYTSEDEKPTKLTEYQAAWVTFQPLTQQIQGLQLPNLPGIKDNKNKQKLLYGQDEKNYECMANSRVPYESITEKLFCA